jgi:hypothetical protein
LYIFLVVENAEKTIGTGGKQKRVVFNCGCQKVEDLTSGVLELNKTLKIQQIDLKLTNTGSPLRASQPRRPPSKHAVRIRSLSPGNSNHSHFTIAILSCVHSYRG